MIDHDKHMCQDCQEMVRGNQESVVAIVACIHDIPGPQHSVTGKNKLMVFFITLWWFEPGTSALDNVVNFVQLESFSICT